MLVSAILPTRGRREYAQQAVECFLAQTYPDKELIVLDDYDDRSFPDGLKEKGIWYWQASRMTIPNKRNQCCELANGEYIIHFDSDDYSVPERIAEQVGLLLQSGKAVGGYRELFIYDATRDDVYRYRSPRPNYVVGTSLIYRRDWWQEHPFNPNRPIASDNEFVYWAREAKQLAVEDGFGKIVARLHPDTSGINVKDGLWDSLHGTGKKSPSLTPVSKDELPQGFFQRQTA